MSRTFTGNFPASAGHVASQLSPRQREILDLVAEGRTSKEIAVDLGISESTVNWHIANAFERLGASSRAEAVALAMRSNGADRAPTPTPVTPPASRAQAPTSWPRLVAVAILIALVGALLGGATVATLQLGLDPLPTASPAQTAGPANSERVPTASPPNENKVEVVGGESAAPASSPAVGDPTRSPLLPSPATLPPVPAISAPTLPSVPVPLPTAAPLPTLPVTPPPLPVPSTLPIPTPTLPIP